MMQIYGNSVRFVRAKTFFYGQTVRFSNLSGLKRFLADKLLKINNLSVKWVYFTDKLVSGGAITGAT